MSEKDWILAGAVAVAVLVVLALAFAEALSKRCRRCKHWWAMYEIDRRNFPGENTSVRYRCRHCGYCSWKNVTAPDQADHLTNFDPD